MKKILLTSFLFLFAERALAATLDLSITPAMSPTAAGGSDIASWIASFYRFSLVGGIFLAVGVIAWAGLRYALAAGNPSTQSDARDQILQALLGLLLLFGAYLILSTIDPQLVNLQLKGITGVSGITAGPALVPQTSSTSAGHIICTLGSGATSSFSGWSECYGGCASGACTYGY